MKTSRWIVWTIAFCFFTGIAAAQIPIVNHIVNNLNPVIAGQKDLKIPRTFREATGDEKFGLYQNVPNPFNPETTIHYVLEKNTDVHLAIYNVLGQPVRVLVNGGQVAGTHSVRWDGRDQSGREVTSGLFLYRLIAGEQFAVRKMVLAK